MRPCCPIRSPLPLLVPLLGGLLACSSAQEPQAPAAPADPAQAQRLAALHAAGASAPFVLHPVQLLARPDTRVAQALGLVLERSGMTDLDVAAVPFVVPADAKWDAVPAQLAAHVQAQPRDAAAQHYHLYAQFLGTPRTGPEEVRFVVVDAAGAVVLVDRQTPADRAFQRTAGRDPDPLGCATLVGDRLFGLADWKVQANSSPDGKFARLWRDLSGAPGPREVQAMAPRLQQLRRDLAKARVVVLPSIVLGGHDAASAGRLAAAWTQRFGGPAAAPADGKQLTVAVDSNEQKRLWDLARGLAGAAKAHAATADYALAVDLGIGGEGSVAWVHIAVCTVGGDAVIVDMQNDQSAMLQGAAPKTLAEAEAFVGARLAQLLR